MMRMPVAALAPALLMAALLPPSAAPARQPAPPPPLPSPLTAPARSEEEAAIRSVIAAMETAWNRGDFRGYMEGFENPGVIFVSRGRFQQDWQGTLDHYIRDYGGSVEKRGVLHFYDIRVEMLAPDAAQLVSRFHLERPQVPQYGINTRMMRKINGRWVIALNHVSAVEEPDPTDPVASHRQSRTIIR